MSYQLEWAQFFPRPVDEVFGFFSDVRRLNDVLPAFARLELLSEPHCELCPGMLFDYLMNLHLVSLRWRTRIESVERPHRFVDVQALGPYRMFEHEHQFYPVPGGTVMVDRIRYDLWLGPLANVYVSQALSKIFLHRKKRAEVLLCSPS